MYSADEIRGNSGIKAMAIKFSRRFFVSLLGSMAAIFSCGANAQEAPQQPKAVIGTPVVGTTQVVGPVIAESTIESPSVETYVKKNQNTVLHPFQTIDHTGYHPNVRE
jgi:hypothetical protein